MVGFLYLTTQPDTVGITVNFSQAYNKGFKNINRNILKCTGNTFYHKWYNEKGLAPTYVKIKVPNTSPAAMFANKNRKETIKSKNFYTSEEQKWI